MQLATRVAALAMAYASITPAKRTGCCTHDMPASLVAAATAASVAVPCAHDATRSDVTTVALLDALQLALAVLTPYALPGATCFYHLRAIAPPCAAPAGYRAATAVTITYTSSTARFDLLLSLGPQTRLASTRCSACFQRMFG